MAQKQVFPVREHCRFLPNCSKSQYLTLLDDDRRRRHRLATLTARTCDEGMRRLCVHYVRDVIGFLYSGNPGIYICYEIRGGMEEEAVTFDDTDGDDDDTFCMKGMEICRERETMVDSISSRRSDITQYETTQWGERDFFSLSFYFAPDQTGVIPAAAGIDDPAGWGCINNSQMYIFFF